MEYKYILNPNQIKFMEVGDHDSDIDVSLYQGGYGSGKTFAGSLLGILLCLKYRGIRGLVGAQTLPLVRDTTLVSYKEHFDSMGLKEGVDWVENKAESKIIFSNNSEILFRHLEEPNKLKSLNLGFIEIEEMSDIPKATFDMLLARLRQKKNPEWCNEFKYRLFGHTNPQQDRGWIYQYFVKNKPSNYKRVISRTLDNESNLPKGFIEGLKERYTDKYYRINVLGEDGDYESRLATKDFKPDEQIKDNLEINKNFPIHITCDFNHDPMCWYICQHYDNNVYILYELVEQYTTTYHCAELVAELLSDYKHHKIIINGDATGDNKTTKGQDYTILTNTLCRLGFDNYEKQLLRSNPSRSWRLKCWNNKVRGMDDGKSHLFISSQCKYLIYNIDELEAEEGTGIPKEPSAHRIARDTNAKFLVHPIDACSYLVCFYYPIKDISIISYDNAPYKDIFKKGKYKYEV